MHRPRSQPLIRIAAAGMMVMLPGVHPSGAAQDAASAAQPAATQPAAAAENAMEKQAAALMARWQERFAAEGMESVVASPWVIATDGDAAALRRYQDGTIRAAERALRKQFFETGPKAPVLILLFESPAMYRRLSADWLDDRDPPHFGYYRRDGIMVMNVSTGTGTLVHELTHALMAGDFPDAPDWFNEGLASLFEQCSITDEGIVGHVNWRLPALQKALRDDRLGSFKNLLTTPDFRGQQVGLNYAQARYLMMYLQENDLLRRFYISLRNRNREQDPSGIKSLEQVIA